jgi:hypothetical protein
LAVASVLLLTEFCLLLLLSQIAKSAAAGNGNISEARSLKVVLLADFGSLHGFWDPMETKACSAEEEKALSVVSEDLC